MNKPGPKGGCAAKQITKLEEGERTKREGNQRVKRIRVTQRQECKEGDETFIKIDPF